MPKGLPQATVIPYWMWRLKPYFDVWESDAWEQGVAAALKGGTSKDFDKKFPELSKIVDDHLETFGNQDPGPQQRYTDPSRPLFKPPPRTDGAIALGDGQGDTYAIPPGGDGTSATLDPGGQGPLSSGPAPRQEGVALQDHVQQYVYDQALGYLDPTTQQETKAWLARDNPAAYSQYKDAAGSGYLAPPSTLDEFYDPNRIGQLVEGLDYQNLLKNLDPNSQIDLLGGFTDLSQPKGLGGNKNIKPLSAAEAEALGKENLKAGEDVKAGLGWLREALQTGAKGARGQTRANQKWAQLHLNTLNKEAEADPLKGGRYKTLYENLMNPIMARNALSGLGSDRALKRQSGEFSRKGFGFRNPGLT